MTFDPKREWHLLKTDAPGQRFGNHRHRMKDAPTVVKVVSLVLAITLIAAGIVLLVIPGPGTPLLIVGIALLAARWAWLARKLDHGEPRLRAWWHRHKLQRQE